MTDAGVVRYGVTGQARLWSTFPPVDLPTDRPRGATPSERIAEYAFAVPAGDAVALRALAADCGVPLVAVLLSAYLILLSRHAGQSDISVIMPAVDGSVIRGRVLRADLSADPRLVSLIRTVADHIAGDVSDPPPTLEPESGLDASPLGELAMSLDETAERLDARLIYREELFDHSRMIRMAGHYLMLLSAAAATPWARLSELEMLTTVERRQLLTDWNGDRAGAADGPLVHELVERQAILRPDAPAVIRGPVRLTYAELNARANQLAHLLRDRGVGPEKVVGVCVDSGQDLIVGLLGVLKAGGAYVPLDPNTPDARLAWMLRDAGVSVVLTQQRFRERVGVDQAEIMYLDTGMSGLATAPEPVVDPENLAYVIYTSGSTGRPKGVQISHGALANYLRWAAASYVTTHAGGAPLFATVACDLVVPVLYAPLITGQPVRVLPADLDLSRLGRAVAESGPYDFIKLTPGQLELLTRQLDTRQARGLATTLVVGGEPVSGRGAARWTALAGGAVVINEYGPTEATVGTTVFTLTGRCEREYLPSGRPIPGTTAYVLDDRHRLVPVGVTGELYLGGAGLARGYVGRPALTAERFVPDPFGPPGSRLYRTGDLACWLPDGNLDFLGRTDGQVKIRGYRVELGEVEHALVDLPQVTQAVVAAHEAESGNRRLVAYVVPHGAALDVARLRKALGRTLPEYMVPAVFIGLDALPLAPNGKVDRAALPDPSEVRPASGANLAQGRTPLERAICRIWAAALFVEEVGIHDNFFDLGGDSLTAVAVMFELRQQFRLDIPVHALFAAPTVHELATMIDAARATAPARTTPAGGNDHDRLIEVET